MIPVLAGVFGALIGSFLNVVIYRVPAGVSIVRPPSACPTCGEPIRALDNIPIVSWLALRGRCRHCRTRISPRYPLIELATALSFALVALVFGAAITEAPSSGEAMGAILVLLAHLSFVACSIALAAIDLDTHRLPNPVVLTAGILGVVFLGGAAIAAGDLESAVRALAGSGILFALYLALALLVPRGMGLGDVKLAAVVGLYLGWAGWAEFAVGAFAAFVLGGLVGILLLAARRARRSTAIPFGPWMLGGAWVGIVIGQPIVQWYFTLFGLY